MANQVSLGNSFREVSRRVDDRVAEDFTLRDTPEYQRFEIVRAEVLETQDRGELTDEDLGELNRLGAEIVEMYQRGPQDRLAKQLSLISERVDSLASEDESLKDAPEYQGS
jgi:hypothetical protein